MLYEASLSLPLSQNVKAEILRCTFANLGIPPENITETIEKGHLRFSFFVSRRSLIPKSALLSVKCLKAPDWQTKWKKYFVPFNLTRRLRLVPFGRRDKKTDKKRKRIYIDTAVAFGTGQHATTQLVAQFIEDKRGKFKTFLDIGTGSGILSVVAQKSGARKILSIDTDKDAVVTAKRNFKLNNVTFGRVQKCGIAQFQPQDKFEFVAANLITDELIKNRKAIISCVKPGYYLAVSGISLDNLRRFRSAFSYHHLKLLKLKKKSGWAGLLYEKR